MFRGEIRSVGELEHTPPVQSGTEVLDHIVDLKGRPIREKMHEIGQNRIRLIMPFGPPRSGKTTFATQLARAMNDDHAFPKRAKLMFFDTAIREAQVVHGLGPIVDWKNDEWTQASHFYFQEIERRLEELPQNTVLIAENVGFGVTDRGITTLEDLARKYTVEAFFVGLISDPRISRRAIEVRRALMEVDETGRFKISDQDVLDFLKRHNLLVSGEDESDPAGSGALIRDIVSRMDFTDEEKLTVDTEEEEEQVVERNEEYLVNGFPQGKHRRSELEEAIIQSSRQMRWEGSSWHRHLPFQRIFEDPDINPFQLAVLKLEAEKYRRIGARLHFSSGLSEHRYVIATNHFMSNVPIHYLDLSQYRKV